MSKLYKNFVNGAFVAHPPEAVIEVFNPATETVLAEVPNTSSRDVDAAVDAARRAQVSWEKLPAIERANYLRRISAGVRDRADELANVIAQEQGKVMGLAKVEVAFTADYIDYMAEWARRIEGEVLTSDRANESIFLLRKPIGVVAGILPWNFPFFLIARKMAPALVTGNTIVIKPSEETPLNAFLFAEIVESAQLPPGVFNLIGGNGATGGQLAAHPQVDLVSFTGSVATGKRIMHAAAANLTRVNLELGGKAPAIVLASADVDLAVNAIYQSRVINTGQVCNCAERVYVERAVHEEFVEKISRKMKATKFGDPMVDDALDMGPLVSKAQLERVKAAVDLAIKQGAIPVTGGQVASTTRGHHFEPTVLVECNHEMDIMRHETFGPVLPIQVVENLDEAIAFANDSDYGLTSSIFTRDINSAMQACRELKFGETYINREHFEAMQGFHAGRRKSGIGGADGKHGLYEFMETHAIYLQS
ncbi:aldehyde dehydrogenase [Achromobacter aegrifaciens]|uniref:Lactaldehyde dehydrogenase n=1 Tax=Achromobacter aegrifaciens TaxID=1287736 RepID=A0AAD2J4Q8_ACHAE|nr:aldehyde dehydrogenase [Achromobacter aegrifaciens]CUJ68974.1 Lactaldehyde dehydrogenase [Achromobacter aegrifaciens]